MSVLSDGTIRLLCVYKGPIEGEPAPPKWKPMITPFFERTVHPNGTSYGLGPCTYDVRVREQLKLRPGAFKLASTLERFVMPRHLCAVVMDKSSLVRQGLTVQNTHLDPGWEGWLTLELKNEGKLILALEPGDPIAQIKFEELDQPSEHPYGGKYQNQPDYAVEPIFEK